MNIINPYRYSSSGTTPANTVAPVISGNTAFGNTLTTTNGTWTGATPITYTYQWKRGGVAISGATNNTYTTVNADIGENITCEVTATNAFGSASATSNAIVVIYSLATALHEWYRPNITDVGTTVTQVDTGSVGGIDLPNPDAVSEPTVNANTLGYDGVAQHLEKATTNFRSADASGVIHCKFKATDNTLNKNNFLFAAAKTSVNDLLNISYRNLHPRFAFQDFGVDVLIMEGSNPFVLNDVNTLTVFSTGTSIKMAVNGVVVASSVISGTNNGQWFHDVTGGTDNVTLAAQKTTSNGFGKSDQYGVWYEPYTSDANALANGLDIQNNAI